MLLRGAIIFLLASVRLLGLGEMGADVLIARPTRTVALAAVVLAFATSLAVQAVLRRRRKQQPEEHEDAATFHGRVRQLHASGSHARGPCVLDACPRLVHHFAIGSFDLVQADLQRVLPPAMVTEILVALTQSGVRRAFAVRRELVQFKKACLLILQDVLRIERGFVRQTTFFYRELRRCDEIDGHDCAACLAWREGRRRELLFCRRCGEEHHATDEYLSVSEWLQSLKGLRVALQDMRGALKTLCLLPRHVRNDEDIHPDLKDMLSGLTTTRLVARAQADAVSYGAPSDSAHVAEAGSIGLHSRVMIHALDAPMAQLPPELPEHVAHFVRQSLFARGTPKAFAQAEGAELLATAVRCVLQRTSGALALLDGLQPGGAGGGAGGETVGSTDLAASDRALTSALRREMKIGRHARTLRTLLRASTPLLDTLDHVTGIKLSCGEPSRLFVASDSVRGEHALWFPPQFEPILGMLRSHKEAHDRFERTMRDTMATEGWPPPPLSRRTRVHEGGSLACRLCSLDFSRLWQERGVCWQCEGQLRQAGRCPFGAVPSAKVAKGSKAKSRSSDVEAEAKAMEAKAMGHPFCPHQSKCAACDASFESCRQCRLAQGDGEAVLAACEEWSPTALFLDFDRTLCTTRGGANPLVGNHTVDAELHAAAVAMNSAHVITRNRHAVEIRTFLEERGVPIATVESTPSGDSKWEHMERTLRTGETAVFVDDAAREVCDPRIAADPRIFRVLFQRW